MEEEVLRRLRARPVAQAWAPMVADMQRMVARGVALAEAEEAARAAADAQRARFLAALAGPTAAGADFPRSPPMSPQLSSSPPPSSPVMAGPPPSAAATRVDPRLAALRDEVEMVQKRLAEVSAEAVDAATQLRRAQGRFARQRALLEAAVAERDALERDNRDLGGAVDALGAELQAAKRKCDALDAELERARSSSVLPAAAELQRDEDRATIENYQKTVSRISEQYNETTEELRRTNDEVLRLQKIVADLRIRTVAAGGVLDEDGEVEAGIAQLAIPDMQDTLPDECLRSIEMPQGSKIQATKYDLTGKWLFFGTTSGMYAYDTSSLALLRVFRNGDNAVTALDMSPDFSLVAAGFAGMGSDRHVAVYKFDSGKPMATLRCGSDPFSQLLFTMDSRSMIVSCRRRVTRFDLARGQEVGFFESPSSVMDMCFTDNNVVAAAQHDHYVRLIDMKMRRVALQSKAHSQPVTSVALSPDISSVLTCSRDHTLNLLEVRMNLRSRKVFSSPDFHNNTRARACLSSGGSYALAGSSSGKILLWSLRTGMVARVVQKREKIHAHGVSWSPCVSRFVATYNDSSIADVFGPRNSW
jgi:WD40 repeat protein